MGPKGSRMVFRCLPSKRIHKVNLKAEHGTIQEEIPIFGKSIHFHPLGRFQDNIHIFGEWTASNTPPGWFCMSTQGTGTRVLYLQGLPSERRSPGEKKWVRRGRPWATRQTKKQRPETFQQKNWLITSWWLNQTQPVVFFISHLAETTLNPLVFALGGRGEKGVGSEKLAGCLVGGKGMVSKWRHHSKTQRLPTQQILK